ncbi:hypothetical protein SCHPADRAFT_938441 [Schizopora paradoxa]|uniref:Uncharacterized protein n=1 Tax=Schizopora paradoxa TaxID=27342 RepID=A0A0H2SF72_9AGAM|nr:hypothetical protein SCHPADRAFT_938441 [Schizopora paradoxa]
MKWPSQRDISCDEPNSDSYFSLLSTQEEDGGEQLTPLCHPRTRDVRTSLGSSIAANSYSEARNQNDIDSSLLKTFTEYDQDFAEGRRIEDDAVSDLEMPPTTISPSPTTSRPRRLSAIKDFFSSPIRYVSRSRSSTCSSDYSSICSSPRQMTSQSSSLQASPSLSEDSSTQMFQQYVDDTYTPSLLDESPPVTPDDFNTLDSPESGSDSFDRNKGKNKAQVRKPFEEVLDDEPEIPMSSIISGAENEEWWGIEIALQASRNERRGSVASTESAGEHSKVESRESWAAINKGRGGRGLDEAKFEEWRKWHQQLEKIDDERKAKRRRTIDFMQESDRLARLFVDELLSESLSDEEVYDALLWTEYISEKYPDPFIPAEKHGLAWTLKRHRSISCLHDLKLVS